jgi:hypothetical protein
MAKHEHEAAPVHRKRIIAGPYDGYGLRIKESLKGMFFFLGWHDGLLLNIHLGRKAFRKK